MRLAICRGDAKEAERMIPLGLLRRIDNADARFALADGREFDALAHMRAAAARGGGCVEAETAGLHHLQSFWLERRQSPAEEGFLALFTKLASVRDCFSRRRFPG